MFDFRGLMFDSLCVRRWSEYAIAKFVTSGFDFLQKARCKFARCGHGALSPCFAIIDTIFRGPHPGRAGRLQESGEYFSWMPDDFCKGAKRVASRICQFFCAPILKKMPADSFVHLHLH